MPAGLAEAGLAASRTGAGGQGPSSRIAARSAGVSSGPSEPVALALPSSASNANTAPPASRAPAAAASARRRARLLASDGLRMGGLPAGHRALERRVLRAR